jgi:hypothetical protein
LRARRDYDGLFSRRRTRSRSGSFPSGTRIGLGAAGTVRGPFGAGAKGLSLAVL